METFRRIIHTTKSDLIGDILVAIAEVKREAPDDARLISIVSNFSVPKTFDITVQWLEYDRETQEATS